MTDLLRTEIQINPGRVQQRLNQLIRAGEGTLPFWAALLMALQSTSGKEGPRLLFRYMLDRGAAMA
ncbi:hypothetical protein Nhal_1143 [Nitrosococcus halophilus Nc 4]|uniref:Uncharacterized protein n=1 Tax=Nitrosococcus halophilus (strain Nc4) TaxID=472759 RepID=D5BZL6_NITHN|nr:hypothetical protein [Nitrosococcus halophilus]ADE14311.1 hypothetical protein Nhal_1143 [Nitrosococcus halophilus Nc 4]